MTPLIRTNADYPRPKEGKKIKELPREMLLTVSFAALQGLFNL